MEHELTRKRTGRLTQIRVTSVVGGQYLSAASFIRVHSCPFAVLIRLRVLCVFVVKIWGQGLPPAQFVAARNKVNRFSPSLPENPRSAH
jgi:hypothetical protein